MSVKLPPEVENLMLRLKQLEDQLRLIVTRRQQVKAELLDVSNALSELEKADEGATVYKSVGTILVKVDRNSIMDELKDRKETLELQERALAKQEANLRKSYEEARKEFENALKKYRLLGVG